jgi:hypothetical protein
VRPQDAASFNKETSRWYQFKNHQQNNHQNIKSINKYIKMASFTAQASTMCAAGYVVIGPALKGGLL